MANPWTSEGPRIVGSSWSLAGTIGCRLNSIILKRCSPPDAGSAGRRAQGSCEGIGRADYSLQARVAPTSYIDGAGLADNPKGPLFRTIGRQIGRPLTRRLLPQANAYRMICRRAAAAGIATKLGNYSFRTTGITAHLPRWAEAVGSRAEADLQVRAAQQPLRSSSPVQRAGSAVRLPARRSVHRHFAAARDGRSWCARGIGCRRLWSNGRSKAAGHIGEGTDSGGHHHSRNTVVSRPLSTKNSPHLHIHRPALSQCRSRPNCDSGNGDSGEGRVQDAAAGMVASTPASSR